MLLFLVNGIIVLLYKYWNSDSYPECVPYVNF